jgi:serine/threonine protein phosphatase PrpC
MPSTVRARSEDPLIPNDTASIRLCVAVSEDKGARQTMEDVVAIDLDGRGGPADLGQARIAFIGVFDGHGGSSCAEMAAEKLHAETMQAGLAKVSTRYQAQCKAAPSTQLEAGSEQGLGAVQLRMRCDATGMLYFLILLDTPCSALCMVTHTCSYASCQSSCAWQTTCDCCRC